MKDPAPRAAPANDEAMDFLGDMVASIKAEARSASAGQSASSSSAQLEHAVLEALGEQRD